MTVQIQGWYSSAKFTLESAVTAVLKIRGLCTHQPLWKVKETPLWPNRGKKSKKVSSFFFPSRHIVTHMCLPQITAYKRTGWADPEGNCSGIANWAGKVISSAMDGICKERAAEGWLYFQPRVRRLIWAPAFWAEVSRLPGRLRVISQSHLRISSPLWNCLRSISSILSKLRLGFLPEKREKDSIKTRRQPIYVGKSVHGQQVSFLIPRTVKMLQGPNRCLMGLTFCC